MNNFLNLEEVVDLLKKDDEKVFKSEKYDLYFTFLGLVDDVDNQETLRDIVLDTSKYLKK